MRVLLVEPDAVYANSLAAFLRKEQLAAEITKTGEQALEWLRHYPFDLVLLDLMLPDIKGSTAISGMRSAGRDTPALALAGSSNARARLSALSADGEDVVERSIQRAELLAHMRAIIRRSREHSQSLLRIGVLTLDVGQLQLLVDGSRTALTGKEFAILQLLVLRRNMVLSKNSILSLLYTGIEEPEAKIVDVFVCKIRSKLAKAGLRDVISTVWGRGYVVRMARLHQAISPATLPIAQSESTIRLTQAVA